MELAQSLITQVPAVVLNRCEMAGAGTDNVAKDEKSLLRQGDVTQHVIGVSTCDPEHRDSRRRGAEGGEDNGEKNRLPRARENGEEQEREREEEG
eukprot:2474814-Rhodomonas_salina.1